MTTIGKCLIEDCGRPQAPAKRGLCSLCFLRAKAKVDAKETTWERLAEMGLCESERDPFDTAYDRATKGE